MKKILIIGQGFLGSSFQKIAVKNDFSTFGTYHTKSIPNCISLDISNIDDVEKIVKQLNPDFIINFASQNDLDFLESHPELAMNVNCIGASNIAQIANETKVKMLHISTDSVFDGTRGNYSENDIPNPINVYAKSKYEGELNVLKKSKNSIIARTNFYGINNEEKYFLNWVLRQLKNNIPMTGYTDVIFSPLNTVNLSHMLLELLQTSFTGIIHLSSNNSFSKYDFISKIISSLNLSHSLVIPGNIPLDNFKAKRPKNTSLSNKLASNILKTKTIEFNDWLVENKSNIMRIIQT